MEMTTDDRIKSVLSSLFPKATDVTYEVADGSTLGYTYFIEVDEGGEQASYVLKLAKTDAEHKLRFYRTDHTGQAAIDAMAVEAVLLDRIAHQTTVPVPRVCLVDSSPEDPLHPYLLLERSEGTPLNLVSASSGDTWQRYLSDIGHHLATLSNIFQFQRYGSLSVCDGTVGVDDDHTTWTSWMDTQYNTYLQRLEVTPLADLATDITAWYRERREQLPTQPASVLVHDDVHLANFLVNMEPKEESLTAIIDWEEVLAAPREFQVARMEYSLFVAGDIDSTIGPQAREWFQKSYWDHSCGHREDYDERRSIYHLLIWLRMAGNLQFDDDVTDRMRATIERTLRETFDTVRTD